MSRSSTSREYPDIRVIDKEKAMEASIYTQNLATINGRNIGHYLVDTSVGQINVIQYEKRKPDYPELETILIYGDYEKAERKFNNICKQILNGRM